MVHGLLLEISLYQRQGNECFDVQAADQNCQFLL